VEDNEEQASAFADACHRANLPGPPIVEIATNRESAIEFIESDEFDVIVCDLAIPLDGSLRNPDRKHGSAVLDRLLAEHGGVPVIVCSEARETAGPLVQRGERKDPFGLGTLDIPMLTFYTKDEIPECKRRITEFVESAGRVASIQVDGASLGHGDERAIQIFACRAEATEASVSDMGGHSADKTLRLAVTDAQGQAGRSVVAKIGKRRRILREASKYKAMAARLPPELVGSQVDIVDAGAGLKGGVFYGYADHFDRDLFACLVGDEEGACQAIGSLRDGFRPLHENARSESRSFAMLRRDVVGNDFLNNADDLEAQIRLLNEVQVPIRSCVQHGDLLGENVLVDRDGKPLLIDYARTGLAAGALDPITLELSAVFHPGAQEVRGGWPSERQVAGWTDLDAFLIGCPFPDFIRATREWTVAVAASEMEMVAVALAYALRQLRYSVNVRPLALALIRALPPILDQSVAMQ
jgi:CheY-like chemotaxis protein